MNKLYRMCIIAYSYRICDITHMQYSLFISHMHYIAYAISICYNADVIYRIMFRDNLCGMDSRFTMSLATSKLYGWWVPIIDYFMEVL